MNVPLFTWSVRGLVLATSLVLSLPVSAEPSVPPNDWQAANREVVALVQAGHYEEAEEKAQAARMLCPGGNSPEATATRVICQTLLQENIGWARTHAGRYAEAEAAYREALAAREQAFAANDPVIGESAAALGFFYIDRQRWDDAAAQLERAVEILGRAGAERAPTLAAAYARLIDAYRAQGRLTAALTTGREAVETLTHRAGADTAVTLAARATLASLLRDVGHGMESMDMALAALRLEALPLDQRVRFTIEAIATANVLGQTEAVRPAFETTLSLVSDWADAGDANQRQALAQLLLAGAELALTSGDPDTALQRARRAKGLTAEADGKVDGPRSAALILEARALLEQGQAEQAAKQLTEAAAPRGTPLVQRAWVVRALMDAGRMAEARAQLGELQAAIVGRPEERSSFAASLLQLSAQMSERSGDPRAALVALEQASAMLPAPELGSANAVQAVMVRREVIRLRAILGDTAGTAAALSALLDAQTKAKLPLPNALDTRLLLGWFSVETRQMDMLRAQISAVDAALPGLEAQAPRSAATILTRLAELSLALPGGDAAVSAMGFLERARLAYERTVQSVRDAARVAILRGRILVRLERISEAVGECAAARERVADLLPGTKPLWRDAVACATRAELLLGQFGPAGKSAARLLESLPTERKVERAEAMRLLAEAQSGQAETDAADRTLRAALDLVADVSPRRAGLRAELWGAISVNLHKAGREREARNAAVAQRQVAGDDNAGVILMMQSLRNEASALLALRQLDEALSVLDQAERLRVAVLRVDPGALAEHDTLLARVELARGRYTEAVTIADRVIAADRAHQAPSHAGLAAILQVRARAQLSLGSFVAAETAQREAIGLLRPRSAEAAQARLGLARILGARGDQVAAAAERDAALGELAAADGANHPDVLLARLDAVSDLVRAGRKAEAEAAIADCAKAMKDREDGRGAHCDQARAEMAAHAGAWVSARVAAAASLMTLRAHGDTDRPDLVAPLLIQAEAAEALGDTTALSPTLDTLSPLLAHASLEERLRGAALRARQFARDGKHEEATAAGQGGLALLGANLPASFAPALIELTQVAADGLLAQGGGAAAADLWRAALKRLDTWGKSVPARAAALHGLGSALQETPDLTGAMHAWEEAATLDPGSDRARLTALAGLVRAALAGGRFDVARARAETLADSTAPGATRLLARLRAEIADAAGDPVSAMLEWWRAATLDGAGGDPNGVALPLARAARAALAAGQPARAEDLLAQARKALGNAPASQDVSLALLEMDARLLVRQPDAAAARAAIDAWADAVRRRVGAASSAALAPELLLAAQERASGENADAAARLSVALGQAERLRGRDSLLWSQVALPAADAAAAIGDDARAAMLRQRAGEIQRRATS